MYVDFRDFAFISSIKSRKYCERVDPVTRTVRVTAAGEEVPSIEYGDTPLEARHHAELADNEMYVWLRAAGAGAGPAEVRLVVTPVRRRCSSLDVWWTPCSGGAGPCVRRDLLCDGIVNCGGGGQQLRAGDEAGATCRTRVLAAGAGADTGQWLVPSFIVFLASSVAGTGALLCCCSHLRRTKPRAEQRGDSGETAACYTEASAPPAPGTHADTEDSPPSYEEAILLLRRP